MQRDRRLAMTRAVVSGNNPYRDFVLLGQLPQDVPGRSRVAVPDLNGHAPAIGGTPTIPLFIGQGANGDREWTPGDKKGIGAGDAVMIASDVRTLARGYYANGTKVYYEQYNALSHISSVAIWLPNSIAWIKERFADPPAPQNCSSIQLGNPLEPRPMPSPQIL